MKNRSLSQRLTLDVDSELAQSWLNPRLPQLLAALPDTEVVLLSMLPLHRSAFERVDPWHCATVMAIGKIVK